MSSFVVGLFWAIDLPLWVIRQQSQITIEGNEFLSPDTIRQLIPLSYPQSIFKLPTHELSKKLESTAPIAVARVSRQLLPPSLTIQIREREPVAIADAEFFLSRGGILLPRKLYNSVGENFQLPTLKAIGFGDRHRPYWSELYQYIAESNVQIFEVDLQAPSNLKLKTELGNVHLGAYTSQFSEQLAVLAQMKNLSERVNVSKIAYIDLRNPKSPAIQMLEEQKDDN